MNYVNTIINPNSPDPVASFVVSRAFIFSKQFGTEVWLTVSDYRIDTDTSILPYENINTKKGFRIE